MSWGPFFYASERLAPCTCGNAAKRPNRGPGQANCFRATSPRQLRLRLQFPRRLLRVAGAVTVTNQRKAMRGESRTPTSHNPGKPECQGKASSGGDSTCADCCDTAGLLPERPIRRQIGTWGRSFPHLRRSEKAGTPQKRIEGVIQSNGIRGEISTGTRQNMNESNVRFSETVISFCDMKTRPFRTIDTRTCA